MAFVFLVAAYISNLLLTGYGKSFQALLILQTLFYTAALLSFLLEKRGLHVDIFYIPYYFTLINIATAHAFLKFLMGEKQVLWTPRKG